MSQQSIFPILKGVAAGVMLILTAAAGQAQEAAAARPETVRVACGTNNGSSMRSTFTWAAWTFTQPLQKLQ